MDSSTSSSEGPAILAVHSPVVQDGNTQNCTDKTGYRRYRRVVAATLTAAALFWIGLEGVSYFGFRRISKAERRRLEDEAASVALRPTSNAGLPTILLMGNSLLLEGLNYQQLRSLMVGRADVTRFAVENTSYCEWYFGIRKLLSRGCRPALMVLSLSPSQLLAIGMFSDYAARHFFLLADLSAASREAHYDLTRFSGLLFGNVSLFYAERNSVRTLVLSTIAPDYFALARRITSQAPRFPSGQEIERIATERMSAVRQATESAGVRFAFLIPPGFSVGEAEITSAGAKTGTRVVVPIHTGQLAQSYFTDGFHLNHEGAQVFTQALASELTSLLYTDARTVMERDANHRGAQ